MSLLAGACAPAAAVLRPGRSNQIKTAFLARERAQQCGDLAGEATLAKLASEHGVLSWQFQRFAHYLLAIHRNG